MAVIIATIVFTFAQTFVRVYVWLGVIICIDSARFEEIRRQRERKTIDSPIKKEKKKKKKKKKKTSRVMKMGNGSVTKIQLN